MFDRTVEMRDQRSGVCLPVGSTFTLQGDFGLGRRVNLIWVSVFLKIPSGYTSVDLTKYFPTRVHVKSKGFPECVSCLVPQHHGGTSFLPSGGSHILFWSHESHTGWSRGAGRPGVDERVLSVRVGTATVSGTGRIHGHGYIPPHISGLLQLLAMEEDKAAHKGKRIKEEDKVRTRDVHCVGDKEKPGWKKCREKIRP